MHRTGFRPGRSASRAQAQARARRALVLTVGAMLLAAGIVGAGYVGGRDSEAANRALGGSWIATSRVAEIAVYAEPRDGEPPIHRLVSPDENGTPLVVDGPDAGGSWLPVLLPVRPNGSEGWVRAGDVELTQTQYRIEVELAANRLTVRRDRQVVLESPIGVGKESTPTPGGRYFVKELIEPPTADSVYGPYVFGLSGFSDVVTSFAGDDEAVIGIHGNNDPSSIGRNVSHGCIRLPNDVVTRMTGIIPLGTPVEIRA